MATDSSGHMLCHQALPAASHLALVDDAAIGVDHADLPMRVHLAYKGWREDAEALAAPQQAVQIVMIVMVQPAG